jgi:AbrB family looped-hinge helix DNA binding protein
VTRKGQTTIPVEMRRKYSIEEGSRLEAIDTGDGILLRPEQTTADLAGSGAKKAGVTQSTTSEIRRERDKAVSSVVVHEVHRLTLQKEVRQVAQLRAGLIGKDFEVIPVDEQLAITSAEIRQEYGVPMADSIIAATAASLRAVCVTDDPPSTKLSRD